MKRKIYTTLALSALTAMTLSAQSAFDIYQLSQGDLRGTARFMSMGGAFTALGGDLTTLSQNPAGIGVYRYSEIGATLDINLQGVTSDFLSNKEKQNQTKVACNNFGYIGTVSLGSSSVMPFFNWGVSYSRAASFDRKYSGSASGSHGSLSNYVAGYTAAEGWPTKALNGYQQGYNPFQDAYEGSYASWLSVLMYNSYAINPSNDNSTDYAGLYNGTPGAKTFDVVEKGYVDEYSLDFGGNILNTVYWGIGFGITDISYQNYTYYTEAFENATITNANANGHTTGSARLDYESYKHMSGTGFNFKIGVIARPINELRLGVAFHTPTYYNINYDGWAQTQYRYQFSPGSRPDYNGYFPNNSTDGCDDYFSFKTHTPYRLMFGAAGIIGQRAIISVDYELRGYGDLNAKDDNGNQYNDITGDLKTYYQNMNIIRLGAEYRLTPNWSIRAGYSWQSSPCKTELKDGSADIYVQGPDNTETQPSFITDNSTQYVTAGLGYHYKSFYVDAAYVYRHRSSDWVAYPDYNGADGRRVYSPTASLSDNQNSIVLSMGFKF